MRTISIEKPSGTFFKTCEPQNRTVDGIQILDSFDLIGNTYAWIFNISFHYDYDKIFNFM